jgi:TonB family protein
LHAKLIHEILPEYPASARAHHIQGNVYVNVLVDENGKIKTASADNCSACSSILNDAAIEAVKKWEYQPTMVDGKRVSVRSAIIFRFQSDKEPAVEVLTRSESTDPTGPLPAVPLDGQRGVIGAVITADSDSVLIKPKAEWKEYVFAEDFFKVSSPTIPLFEKRTHVFIHGETEEHRYSMVSKGIRYTIEYEPMLVSDHRSPKQLLADLKKRFARSALPNTEKSISLGKYPGIEMESEDASTHSRYRAYVANHRLYIVIATVFKGAPFPEDLKRWDASLELLDPNN